MSSVDRPRDRLPTKQMAASGIFDRHLPTFLVAALAVFLFFLTYVSPISYAGGDARYSLLVSQALIQHGTTQLDPYIDGANLAPDDSRLTELGGHYYYYSALGTPIFSIPAVWFANWFGLDMVRAQDDFQVQSLLASSLTALLLIVLYHLARCYVQWHASIVIASITVFGSTVVSTMGTALWNFNFAVLFVSLALLLLVRYETGHARYLYPYLMGTLFFAALLSRPTTVLFIVPAFIYIFFFARKFFWTTMTTFLVLVGLLILLSSVEYDLWLPPYYLPERHGMLPSRYLAGYRTEALPFPLHFVLYGLLFSPSRGSVHIQPGLSTCLGQHSTFHFYSQKTTLVLASARMDSLGDRLVGSAQHVVGRTQLWPASVHRYRSCLHRPHRNGVETDRR